ncbi:Two-component system sensor protein [Pseudoalteromonas luteoviolacea B = ATCC 29581]|nr:Two-component system sensor protein [Pseudoalteromonas luteoviolacea B = ATCC 29581]
MSKIKAREPFNPILCISGILGTIITATIVKSSLSVMWLTILIGLFMVGFLAVNLASYAKQPKRLQHMAIMLQLVLFVILSVFTPNVMSHILLVIIAGQLPFIYTMRRCVWVVVAVNFFVGAIHVMYWQQNWLNVVINNSLYLAFQCFSLAISFNAIKEQLARETLEFKNAELAATQTMLAQSIRQSERLQLSRDLHDICGHQLTALILNLDYLSHQSEPVMKQGVDETKQLAKELLNEIRKVVRAERASIKLDLVSVINELTSRLTSRTIYFEHALANQNISNMATEALFRVCQEALTNAIKYGSGVVFVRLQENSEQVTLSVENDINQDLSMRLGSNIGLNSMKERMEQIGGALSIHRDLDKNKWQVTARVPTGEKP